MSIVLTHDVASLGAMKKMSAVTSLTAGGTGDATTVTGTTIDKYGFDGGGLPGALAAGIAFEATLTSGETLSLGWTVQHSADGSDWSDLATGSETVATGTSTTTTFSDVAEIGVDLAPAERYVRLNFTPDLSADGTDTATAVAAGFFAGFDRLPQ